jgi:hypothetical protein
MMMIHNRVRITDVAALHHMITYSRRRYGLTMRNRFSDTGPRVNSLKGSVKSDSGEDCVILMENVLRILPKIAILSEPFLQKSEDILNAAIQLYEELVEQMPFMKFLESPSCIMTYYHLKKSNGTVMNSSFFSRRFMVYLDLPVAAIADQLSKPPVNSGAMLYYQTPISINMSEEQQKKHNLTLNHLAYEFCNDLEFNYFQLFNETGSFVPLKDMDEVYRCFCYMYLRHVL